MKTLKEIFLDLFSESILCEMALERKEAMLHCKGVSFLLVKHFIKVMLFPDHQDYEHWRTEIRGWLNSIDQIIVKQKSRKLKLDDLYKTLYDGPVGHDDGVKILVSKMITYEEIPFIAIKNFDNIQKKIETMYYQLCDDLSIDKMERVDYYIDMLKGN